MSYSEVVKNFNRIREYMREFYIYGFKYRAGFSWKSGRSYDDERRRLESWLGEYMQFRQTPEGKRVFLSIDSRATCHNPLYKAWKAKSFTDGDITLHFILMDILAASGQALSLGEIMVEIDRYLSGYSKPRVFDESTVRRKLKEYVAEGILAVEKQGKMVSYRRRAENRLPDTDMLDFFSEVAPCGVIGSFLLDKKMGHGNVFVFKHHYITGAMDSEVIGLLFEAMGEKRAVTLEMVRRREGRISRKYVIPLRIMASAQGGRQYLMAYVPEDNRIRSFRVDHIVTVRGEEMCSRFEELRNTLDRMQSHMWGVSTQGNQIPRCEAKRAKARGYQACNAVEQRGICPLQHSPTGRANNGTKSTLLTWLTARGNKGQRLEHVEFTVHYGDYEQYIHRRLQREKRCGTVERIDQNTSRFSADVFDATELIPWIRTYICRISDIHFSDAGLEARFKHDLEEMYKLYGLEGGGST